MNTYAVEDVLRLAKRVNNTKRTYLLVNPMQAKHMPVNPSTALDMMQTLGRKLAQKYPQTRLIVGFAETATAIGAAVAECFGQDCVYMHTTREELPQVKDWVLFLEEHSHAAQQKLVAEGFLKALEDTSTVLFVEDEISTGRTLRNMICQMQEMLPQCRGKKMVAASIINRMSEENERMLLEAGIACESLVRLPDDNLSEQVERFQVQGAERIVCRKKNEAACLRMKANVQYLDPRQAVCMGEYNNNLKTIAQTALDEICELVAQGSRVLVLGTEECMYPALVLGKALEAHCEVYCHATTRSPIGISDAPGYPITNGVDLVSFYEKERKTFIYDLGCYDAAIIVTDAEGNVEEAMDELSQALCDHGTTNIFYLKL